MLNKGGYLSNRNLDKPFRYPRRNKDGTKNRIDTQLGHRMTEDGPVPYDQTTTGCLGTLASSEFGYHEKGKKWNKSACGKRKAGGNAYRNPSQGVPKNAGAEATLKVQKQMFKLWRKWVSKKYKSKIPLDVFTKRILGNPLTKKLMDFGNISILVVRKEIEHIWKSRNGRE
jgi:hypothetical protein